MSLDVDRVAYHLPGEFDIVDRKITRDGRMHLLSRALLNILLSHRSGFEVTVEYLARTNPEGEYAIRKGLKELEKFGYLERRKWQDEKGHWQQTWKVHERPVVAEGPGPEIPASVDNPVCKDRTPEKPIPTRKNHGSGIPEEAIPTRNFPHAGNCGTTTLEEDQPEEDQQQSFGLLFCDPANSTDLAVPDTLPSEAEFEAFWVRYPRHVAKAGARKAWAAAVKAGVPKPFLQEQASRFAARHARLRTEPMYIPHAATWLNQRRWEDPDEPMPQTQVERMRSRHQRETDNLFEAWGRLYGTGEQPMDMSIIPTMKEIGQ